MGRRTYYCDYCDRSFQDNLLSRKRHLDGASHKAMRSSHYDQFKEPLEALREEAAKPMCQMWRRTGNCSYGPRCKYKHSMLDPASLPPPVFKEESLAGPWVRVPKTEIRRTPKEEPVAPEPLPRPPRSAGAPLWRIAQEAGIPPAELPPSMQPPPPGGWVLEGPAAQWG